MRRGMLLLGVCVAVASVATATSSGRDRPFSTAELKLDKLWYSDTRVEAAGVGGQVGGGGAFSKV